MDRIWAELITDISIYSVVIPFCIGVLKFSNLNILQKWVAILVLVTSFGELAIYIMDKVSGNNLPVVHLFTVFQFVIFVLIMKKGLTPLIPKRVFDFLIVFFVLFAFCDAFWWHGIYNFNTYSRPLSGFILLFLALCFFYKTLKELKIKHLEKTPLFWVSAGILVYFSGSLFIFLFTNFVKSSDQALLTLWGIHAIFNILLNISFTIALWIKPVK